MRKTLGQRIRELREEHDLSLREFAKELGGLSAAHLSDIELSRRYPSDDLLAKMAKVLKVSVDELKSHDPRPPVEELKRIIETDPTFGFALRKILDKEISAEDLLDLAHKKPDRKK